MVDISTADAGYIVGFNIGFKQEKNWAEYPVFSILLRYLLKKTAYKCVHSVHACIYREQREQREQILVRAK